MNILQTEISNWLTELGMNAEGRRIVANYPFPENMYNEYKTLFWNDIETCYENLLALEHAEFYILSFYARVAYEYLYKDGKDMDIVKKGFYAEGCRDIVLWAEDCKRRHGYYGIADEHHWFLGKILDTTVVRIGRLEFERYCLEQTVQRENREWKKGCEVINVHIPAGEPLNYEVCTEAYRKAEQFFGKKDPVFVCESWLLSPVLKELLPEDSNIIRFQQDYMAYEILWEDRQAEERIFGGELLDDPGEYPGDTTLQKKAKERLLQGKKIPGARGIRIKE